MSWIGEKSGKHPNLTTWNFHALVDDLLTAGYIECTVIEVIFLVCHYGDWRCDKNRGSTRVLNPLAPTFERNNPLRHVPTTMFHVTSGFVDGEGHAKIRVSL